MKNVIEQFWKTNWDVQLLMGNKTQFNHFQYASIRAQLKRTKIGIPNPIYRTTVHRSVNDANFDMKKSINCPEVQSYGIVGHEYIYAYYLMSI